MSVLSSIQSKAVQVGNDAWWVLEFYQVDGSGNFTGDPITFSSSDYYASIDATLPSNLEGGNYTIKIEGLIDSDYAKISESQKSRPVGAKLYLLWHDAITGAVSYLKNLTGISSALSASDLKDALVAQLYIAKVSRSLGTLTYDTEIHAVEWVWHALNMPIKEAVTVDTYAKAADEIGKRTGVTILTYPVGAARMTNGDAGTEKRAMPKGRTYASILRGMASALEVNLNRRGRGMLLIRDGRVHLGPRDYPLDGDVKDLAADNGLLEAKVDGSSEKDPSGPNPDGSSRRAHFSLTMKGRPDIKPGDVVRFDPATEDDAKTTPGIGAALAGALAGPLLPQLGFQAQGSTTMAVSSVRHQLGKAAGFSSEVKGVVIDDADHAWDSLADKGSTERAKQEPPASDPANDAAGAIADHLNAWSDGLFSIDIGQVRAFLSETDDPAATPSQTENVWEGLQPVDEGANGTRRLPIDPNHGLRFAMPYASPFAWGKCGLVLPRYPGVRVVMAHRKNMEDETIDLGALWESGSGPDSKAGDWWLILPVGVDENSRDRIEDDASPSAHQGAVTQDLIDADGNRIIELGSLTVTVGKSKLKNAGERPSPADDQGSIAIRHSEGESEIVMLQDGTIRIKGAKISLEASGDIDIKGTNVNVSVSGRMDVS
jgi:hypothetical protein